jgi:hypothetical protein
MSDDIIKGESLYNADDVFPESISNTPWRGVFEGLRGGLNDLFSRADDSFFARSFALFYRVFDIVFRDTPIIDSHDVLDGLAKAYCIPAWNVEGDPVKGLYVLMAWLNFFPTKDKFYNLLVESGLNVDDIVIQRQEYSAGNTRLYYWVYVGRLRDSFFFKDSWLCVQVAFRSFLPFDISLQVNEVTPTAEEATKLYFASDKSNIDIPENLNWPGDALYDEDGAEYHPENSLEKVEVISVFEKDENSHPLRIAQQFENEIKIRYDADDNTINYAHLYNTTFQAAFVYLLEYENPPAEFSYFLLSETGEPIDVDKDGTYILYDENGTPVSTEDYPAEALEQGGVRSYGKNIRCYGVFFDTEQHILTIEFHEAEDLKHVDRVYYRVAPPPPSYEEITVYADVSTTKYCQNNITNNTSADVNTSSIIALYTDEARTKRFKFDYSNDYEIGYYSSITGDWVSEAVQTINDMPATTANPGAGETVTKAFLLLDTGVLWLVCNNSNTSYAYTNQHAGFYGSVKLRIRKKDQQYYAGYFNSSQTYNNTRASYRSSFYLYAVPGLGSEQIALRSDFGTYVSLFFVGYYNAAGVLVSSGYTNFAKYTSTELRVIYFGQDDGTLKVRTALYELTRPTYTGWLSTGHTNVSTNSGQNYVFYDENGEYAMGDSQYLYIPIGIFDDFGGGRSVGTTQAIINACSMGVSGTNYLYFTQSTGTAKNIARIWYIKVPKS